MSDDYASMIASLADALLEIAPRALRALAVSLESPDPFERLSAATGLLAVLPSYEPHLSTRPAEQAPSPRLVQ